MSGEQSPFGRDVLYSKSSAYIRSALGRKAVSDFNTYQLFASVALELLGKAALAGHNPCLVAEPSDRKSMLTAAGFEAAANARTIGASVVYDYLEMVIPNFDHKIRKFCLGIAARRNAELHSGLDRAPTRETGRDASRRMEEGTRLSRVYAARQTATLRTGTI